VVWGYRTHPQLLEDDDVVGGGSNGIGGGSSEAGAGTRPRNMPNEGRLLREQGTMRPEG
jgi:hypothetical protein